MPNSGPSLARAAGALGLVGPVLLMVAVLAAMLGSPWFTLWDSSLSDLGVSSTAPLFNWGLIIAGFLGALFALGIGVTLGRGKGIRLLGAALLAVAMALLAAIGIYTEDWGSLHFHLSLAFFVLLLCASLVLGVSFRGEKAFKDTGDLALAASLAGILSWLLPRGEGLAIPELLSSVPSLAWMLLLGTRMVTIKNE